MSPQAAWILKEEIAPRIAGAVPRTVLCVGPEDSEELVQDTIVQAAKMVDRLEQQGKLNKVTPGKVAFYCIQHAKSGRRAAGSSATDVMGSQTQLNGQSEMHLMSEVVSQSETGDEIHELHDVISTNHEDPSTIATRKLDWAVLLSRLSTIERVLVKCLTDGLTTRETCRRVKMTKNMLAELQHQVAQKILEVMGTDVLKDVVQVPQWRIVLDCECEQLACRADRRN